MLVLLVREELLVHLEVLLVELLLIFVPQRLLVFFITINLLVLFDLHLLQLLLQLFIVLLVNIHFKFILHLKILSLLLVRVTPAPLLLAALRDELLGTGLLLAPPPFVDNLRFVIFLFLNVVLLFLALSALFLLFLTRHLVANAALLVL